ncbi:MAG: hypothetical protein M3N29_00495 [Chloroflexota bacterium]|nr:hypothetical protein [Chloroflexota bacterium]
MLLRVALVPLLTVLLGLCAAVSLFVFGAYDPTRVEAVLAESWFLVYVVQALLVGLVLYVAARLLGARIDGAGLSAVIVAAWIAELLVLAVGVFADVGQGNAVADWVLVTGGPIQPFAAITGALLGLGRQLTVASA